MDAVGALAAVDDHAERRPRVRRDGAGRRVAGQVLPAGEREVAADRLQPVDPFLRDAGHVCDHPAPFPDDAREIGVRGLEAHDLELEVGWIARRRVAAAERVHLGAPARRGDALGGGHEWAGRARSGGDELADRARLHHVVAQELEGVLQPLRELGRGLIRLHVQEIDAQPHDALALAVHLEERDVHREVVFVRGAVGRGIDRLKGALIQVRGHSDGGGIVHRVAHAAPALGGIEQRLAQEEKRLRALGDAEGAAGDRAVRGDGHALALEDRLAGAVGRSRAAEGDHHESGIVRHRGVELGQRGEAPAQRIGRIAVDVVEVEPTDRRDPRITVRKPRGARRVDRLHIGNRVRVLERRVVAGPVAHQDDVVVVVDDPRHHRAAAQVDDLRVVSVLPPRRVADLGEAPISDRHCGDDRVLVVHRVYLAVHEHNIRRVVRRCPPGVFFLGVFFLACGSAQHRAARRGGCRALDEPAARESAPLLVRGHFSSP